MRPLHRTTAAGHQGENDHRAGSYDNNEVCIADDLERQFDDAGRQTQDPKQVEYVRSNDVADGASLF